MIRMYVYLAGSSFVFYIPLLCVQFSGCVVLGYLVDGCVC